MARVFANASTFIQKMLLGLQTSGESNEFSMDKIKLNKY